MPALDTLTRRRAHARKLVTLFNKRYFNGELPKVYVGVGPGKLGCGEWGYCEWDQDGNPTAIMLAEACWGIDANNAFLRSCALHELLHLKLGPKVGHDSPEWKAEALRLSKLGAFVETI